MLKVLHLVVSKVDEVLHCHQPATAARGGARGQTGCRRHMGPGGGTDATWGHVGRSRRVRLARGRSAGAETGCRCRRPEVRIV
jgi:hypothetical protein